MHMHTVTYAYLLQGLHASDERVVSERHVFVVLDEFQLERLCAVDAVD